MEIWVWVNPWFFRKEKTKSEFLVDEEVLALARVDEKNMLIEDSKTLFVGSSNLLVQRKLTLFIPGMNIQTQRCSLNQK